MTEESGQYQDQDRGRMTPRTDRYNALPDKTRMFIEQLHDDDLANLADLLKMTREKGMPKIRSLVDMADGVSTLGRVSKWTIITAVALFSGVAGVITAWQTFVSYFRPTGHL